MRIKRIVMFLALVLGMGAFFMPAAAYAGGADPLPAPVSAPAEAGQEAAAETSGIPFTPEGTGTVLDEADGEKDHKKFYTITSAEGNVFYLIIDGERGSENVYFLNAVTESDLMALAEKDGEEQVSAIPVPEVCTCGERCEPGKVDITCRVCKNDLSGCTGKEAPAEEPEREETEPEKKGTGGVGAVIFILLAFLAAAGAGYYVKIVRPGQQAEDDEDDPEDEGYGEGFDPDEAFGDVEFLPEDGREDQEGRLW